jgi:hypothetical protein
VDKLKKKLLRGIVKDKESGCWHYYARLGKFGAKPSKSVSVDGETHTVAFVAWSVLVGRVPDGLCVQHMCNDTLCVNPQHLFLHTSKNGRHDVLIKARRAESKRR